MISNAVKQQVLYTQRQQIAAIILEDQYGYSHFSSGDLIANYRDDAVVPKGLSADVTEARRLELRRCKSALLSAHRIQQFFLTGKTG